eukprot:1878060-Amphidinium_carterae.1
MVSVVGIVFSVREPTTTAGVINRLKVRCSKDKRRKRKRKFTQIMANVAACAHHHNAQFFHLKTI